MYLLFLLIGLIGFVAMTAMGFLHTGHHGSSHGGNHGSVGHGHQHGLGHNHAHHAHASSPKVAGQSDGQRMWFGFEPWSLISPINIFGWAMGAGIVGLLLQGKLSPLLVGVASGAGALALRGLVIGPMMRLLLRFESQPSDGLEGTIAHNAQAITGFDSKGQGLVKVVLDGQEIQLLAQLDRSELSSGTLVTKGDSLTIVEVDPARNRCTVSKELSSQLVV